MTDPTPTPQPDEQPAVAGSITALLDAKTPRTTSVTVATDAGPVEMVFRSIGRAWETLVRDHPPTDEQDQAYREALIAGGATPATVIRVRLSYNTDTFPPAAIAACCTSHPMTRAEATALWDDDRWSAGELAAMFRACEQANTAVDEKARRRLGE